MTFKDRMKTLGQRKDREYKGERVYEYVSWVECPACGGKEKIDGEICIELWVCSYCGEDVLKPQIQGKEDNENGIGYPQNHPQNPAESVLTGLSQD